MQYITIYAYNNYNLVLCKPAKRSNNPDFFLFDIHLEMIKKYWIKTYMAQDV
jgi:hypothetical protein